MNKPVLNEGQQAAAEAFFDFLFTDEPFFVISGSAGTGKTFLMKAIANDIMARYESDCRLMEVKPQFTEVVFTATTNKASEVLEVALGAPVQTIHSLLGLKVTEDYKTGKTILRETDKAATINNSILFIDECSMIDTALFNIIMSRVGTSKVVFVGDHAQLAPIDEKLSKCFALATPQTTAHLTEPVRNAGQPALMALCNQLRETVDTGIFKPIKAVPGVIDYLSAEDMEAGIYEIFADHEPSCRVLAYTNTRVADFNQFIREDVRGQPPQLQQGDICVTVQAYTYGKINIGVERALEIVSISGELFEKDSHLDDEMVPYRKISVRSPGGSSVISDLPVAENPARVRELVKRLAKHKRWSDYFDLKGFFLDIQAKDSCTVYKAQGSTYDSVFVDLGNIGTSYSAEQVARMLFVAVSRARNRVYLFGRLPQAYHDSKGKPQWQPQSLETVSSTSPSTTEFSLRHSPELLTR